MVELNSRTRINANKLLDVLEMKRGTKIPENEVKILANSKLADVVTINGKSVKVSASMIHYAKVIDEWNDQHR